MAPLSQIFLKKSFMRLLNMECFNERLSGFADALLRLWVVSYPTALVYCR